MGNGSSALVDCVQDCDTQRLKQMLASRVADVEDDELDDDELHAELEDAVHTALSMEIPTPHQYQQLQIALELLLHVAPTALQTSQCNDVQWTALHRACVTSNLAFVAFLFHRYRPYLAMDRDAFGLLPLDLVPPELSFLGAKDKERKDLLVTGLPTTERERIELALDVLRQSKTNTQQHTIEPYLPMAQNETNQNQDMGKDEPFFIALEPRRGQLSLEIVGVVHEIHEPLRVRYHVPHCEPFLHGYFQLIWRGDDDPRSEEPHYERHVLLKESVEWLDHAAPEILTATLPSETRRLHDAMPETLTGSVVLEVAHLPDEVVCHVLFVASDRQLMKREIVLSTEGVRLVRADLLNVHPSEMESYSEDDDDEREDRESDGDEQDGFVFHVGGEAFTHPSEALAGRAFETVDAFEAFVKELRATTTQEQHEKTKATTVENDHKEKKTKHDSVRRPSVLLSNQEQDDDDATEDPKPEHATQDGAQDNQDHD